MPKNKKIKPFVHKAADHFLAITNRAKEALIIEGVPESNISVVNYGIDLKRFFPQPKNERLMSELTLHPDDVVILFIGRFVWEKGVFEILYALKKIIQDSVHSRSPNLRCLIVGSGEEKVALTKMIERLNLANEVRLLTDYPYQLVPEVHSLADIFIMPSVPLRHLREQYGMVLIEAMAMGKPVVSTYCGSVPEVIEDAGFLVPPADHFALSQAIDHLIKNPEARREIGKKARGIAERKYDAIEVSTKIHGIYQALLSP
jgi:colanic acid/amylovoran biosynthesis glycosyltransferase